MKYYAVAKGIKPGIYKTWAEAEKMVKGFPGAAFKSFPTEELARAFITGVKPQEVQEDGIKIYTDGSFRNGRCGYGVVILDNGKKITAHGRVPKIVGCTNNVAELYGIYVALSLIRKDVSIYTDSRYSILCMEGYCETWGEEKPNVKLIHAIAKLMKGRKVAFQHVKAHCGIELNEEVDRLAEIGGSQEEPLIITNL